MGEKDRENRGGGFGEGEGDGEEGGPQAKPSSGRFRRAEPAGPGGAGAACGPGLRLAGAGGGRLLRGAGGGARQAGERESRRAVSPDGAAARDGLLRRKWQDWKVKGMFTSLYGKNVLQYIIGKLPEKITPPRAGSKEHRL